MLAQAMLRIISCYLCICGIYAAHSIAKFSIVGIEKGQLTVVVSNDSDSVVNVCVISSACPQLRVLDKVSKKPLPLKGNYPLITYGFENTDIKPHVKVNISLSIADLKKYYDINDDEILLELLLDSRNNKWMGIVDKNTTWVSVATGLINIKDVKFDK